MNDNISVKVNGQDYFDYVGDSPYGLGDYQLYQKPRDINIATIKEVNIETGIDAIAGSFELIIANRGISVCPIKAGDNVDIFVNGVQVIGGVAQILEVSYNHKSHDVRVSGHDRTIDLVDSSIIADNQIYDSAGFIERTQAKIEALISGKNDDSEPILISLYSVIRDVLNKNGFEDIGLKISKELGSVTFKADEFISAEEGESVFEHIEKYASKAQVMLCSDNQGGIIIRRTPTATVLAPDAYLKNKIGSQNSRIESANMKYDISKRYGLVYVKSQEGDDVDVNGAAIDLLISPRRQLLLTADTVMKGQTALQAAKWEVNKRISDSVVYSCSVSGFRFSDNYTSIFAPGLICSVDDDFAGVEETMLIRAVSYSMSTKGGYKCGLEMISKDSYTFDIEAKANVGDGISGRKATNKQIEQIQNYFNKINQTPVNSNTKE